MILVLAFLASPIIHWNFERLHFYHPLFKENKNMKYVTQKDRKHTLLLATNVPSSNFFGWRRMRSAGHCAGHSATRTRSAYFLSDFARTPGFFWSMRALVAWRGELVSTEGKIRVLSVSSLFSTWVGVYVGVCVCIHTHTHTLHRWGTRTWAQESGWDTWRAWRNQME